MGHRKDTRSLGWIIVGAVLVVSGMRHMYLQQIYGRVRLPESVPFLQGWPVVILGFLEFAVGVWLIYRMIQRIN